jgi:hypothetical protein
MITKLSLWLSAMLPWPETVAAFLIGLSAGIGGRGWWDAHRAAKLLEKTFSEVKKSAPRKRVKK